MIRLSRPPASIDPVIELPYSKSVLNRALILKALAGDELSNVLDHIPPARIPDDVLLMHRMLSSPPPIAIGGEIDVQNAGTVMRFLTAFFALQSSEVILKGSSRMQQRPIGPLVQALRSLGADITYAGNEDFPPLKISAGNMKGGILEIDSAESSQYISALLMIAPMLSNGLQLRFNTEPVSLSYIEMTLDLMKRWGVHSSIQKDGIRVEEGRYTKGIDLPPEADWSSASYWYIIASFLPGSRIFFPSLQLSSTQGDKKIAEWMKNFGIVTTQLQGGCEIRQAGNHKPQAFTEDLSSCPDLVPALAVACAMHRVNAEFRGVAHLRLKESNRLEALGRELSKLHISLKEEASSLTLFASEPRPPAEAFHTYGDHRMAMSLASIACFFDVSMDEPAVVSKSYPAFWEHMKLAGFRIN